MNIGLHISNVLDQIYNIKILDKKKNNIFDGEFTKIVYSDENVSLNGLYLYVPIFLEKSYPVSNTNNHQYGVKPTHKVNSISIGKNILYFQTHHPQNALYIQQIKQLEREMIDYYKEYMNSDKTPLYGLYTQLISGTIRFYRESVVDYSVPTANKYYILKISGIWESNTTIGVTYKFIEMSQIASLMPSASLMSASLTSTTSS